MSEDVTVTISVSREAAQLLRDTDKAKRIGRLVSDMLRPATPETDPLATLIAVVKAEARADGLTDAAIDAELAAYNAERRL
jgi:hypothetical protein